MTTGLTEFEMSQIRAVLVRQKGLRGAVLFGSRAKGTARSGSDIDIAVTGLATQLDAARLASELDELPLPYKFDVVSEEKITNQALLDHIRRVGIPITLP